MAFRGSSSGAPGYWKSSDNAAKRVKAAGAAEDTSFLDDPFGGQEDVRTTAASYGAPGGGYNSNGTRCYSCLWCARRPLNLVPRERRA
jgi:hypothetical protein